MNKLIGTILFAMIATNVMADAARLISYNQHLAQTSVDTVAATNYDGEAVKVGYALAQSGPNYAYGESFLAGQAASYYGNAFAAGSTSTLAIDANHHAQTSSSEILVTNGPGYAAGIAENQAISVGNQNQAYSGTAVEAAGNAFAAEHAAAQASS